MWAYLVVAIIAAVATVALLPKPPEPQPADFDDLTAPTAEEGREIPVLFGTRDASGPNVVWYGDLKVDPYKKKGGKK